MLRRLRCLVGFCVCSIPGLAACLSCPSDATLRILIMPSKVANMPNFSPRAPRIFGATKMGPKRMAKSMQATAI